ncbi:MAG: hypothetical protein WBC44_20195 [Planctomycetaceae bacterium]
MRTHLLKLTAFAAVQAGLFAFVTYFSDSPAAATPADNVALTAKQRLLRSLDEQLYRRWLGDPATIRKAVEQGANDPALEEAFETFQSNADGYLMSIADKDRLLRTAPGRRLILIGGSNLAFGIDGRILAERYGLTPVNLGIHEMLRADYMLRHAAAHVREGDVVVFCFEYGTLLSGGGPPDPELRESLCEILPSMERFFAASSDTADATGGPGWKDYADELALAEFAAHTRDVADRFRQRAARTPARLGTRGFASDNALRRRFNAEFAAAADRLAAEYIRWNRTTDVYARSGFNEYGDFVGHYGLRSSRTIPPNGIAALNESQRAAISKSLAVLNRYVADYRQKGADVFFAYPPLCEGGQEFAAGYEALVAAECDAPILFPIDEARTRLEQHYDTGYHLNWGGVCRRMQVWTTALDRHLPVRVALTPVEHVAARARAVRTTILAANPPSETTMH